MGLLGRPPSRTAAIPAEAPPGMVIGQGHRDRDLTPGDVRRLVAQGTADLPLGGRRVLVLIPDGTRTTPMPLMFEVLTEIVGPRVAALDFLVALGTHQPMSDEQLGRLIGRPVAAGRSGRSRIFNHRWDLPDTFVLVDRQEVRIASHLNGLQNEVRQEDQVLHPE